MILWLSVIATWVPLLPFPENHWCYISSVTCTSGNHRSGTSTSGSLSTTGCCEISETGTSGNCCPCNSIFDNHCPGYQYFRFPPSGRMWLPPPDLVSYLASSRNPNSVQCAATKRPANTTESERARDARGSSRYTPGLCFNIKTLFPGIGIPIIKIRRSIFVIQGFRSSHLYDGSPYTGKAASLYWNAPWVRGYSTR